MTRSPRLMAVVADDLTGAADATAPFASRGLTVSVVLEGDLPPDSDVVAVVTDNRWRPVDEARVRMRTAVERLRAWGPETLFIKVDSTLRGRVRDDVEVALQTWGARDGLVTPAFPGQGRIVRAGALSVHGRTVVQKVADHFPPGVRHLDVTTDDDLVEAARAVLTEGLVAIGSGGLSRALAAVLVPDVERGQPEPTPAPYRTALLVVGTPHGTTAAQVQHTVDAGALLVRVGDERQPAVRRAADALLTGRRVVLVPHLVHGVEPDSPEAAELTDRLAAVARELVGSTTMAGMVLTGGATAHAVADAVGTRELRVHGEVAEGLPRGELLTANARIPVVTKSGGFGSPDFLSLAATSLEDRA